MDSINLFLYIEKNTPIHKLNPLSKTVFFFIINLMIFTAGFIESSCIFLSVLSGLMIARLNVIKIIKGLRLLLLFIVFILIFGVIDIHSSGTFYVNVVQLEKQGLFIYKLIISFFMVELFLATTKISDINNIITIAASKIPLVRRLDPGLYLSLTLSFIPGIIREYGSVMAAIRIRNGDNIRNPVKKIMLICIPLITIMVKKALNTAAGLQIKCYTGNRTIIIKPINVTDIVFITVTIFCYAVSVFL